MGGALPDDGGASPRDFHLESNLCRAKPISQLGNALAVCSALRDDGNIW